MNIGRKWRENSKIRKMKTKIITIENAYQRKGKDIKYKKRGELGELISFKDNVEKAIPRVMVEIVNERVTRLTKYIVKQKVEGNMKNAWSESLSEIEQILVLSDTYDVDGSDFAKRLDPQVRRVIHGLRDKYNKYKSS
jgi:hypothetical protein